MGNFNMLPSDVMLEILSRVPTESVLECKLVSKPWKDLLRHLSFSKMHLNHLNDFAHDSGKLSFIFSTEVTDNQPYYYTQYDEKSDSFSRTRRINLILPFKRYYILGSCNGLICFNAYIYNYHLQPAFICNPITRECILLPTYDGANMLCGFGYVPSTNEYKVVRICKYDYRHKNDGIIQIYTLGSGIGWRNGRKMNHDVRPFVSQGVFSNGAIHWLNDTGTVVAFDLLNEVFQELPSLPIPWVPIPCLPGPFPELHVLDDSCAYYHRASGDIWVLKKNISSHDVIWSKEISNINVKPITSTKSGGILCYNCGDYNFYRYASKASSSRMLVNFGKNFTDWVCHTNTLVSLKELGEENTKLMESSSYRLVCSLTAGTKRKAR